jgi:hypothetical protein
MIHIVLDVVQAACSFFFQAPRYRVEYRREMKRTKWAKQNRVVLDVLIRIQYYR